MNQSDMTIIVPVKAESARCSNKNFRPFTDLGESLLEVKIGQLLSAGIDPTLIVLATDSRELIAQTDFDTIDDSGHNATFAEALGYWIGKVNTDDLAIVHVTCPLFDRFGEFFETWNALRSQGSDSLCVVKSFRHFVLDADGLPLNFRPGPWHGSGSQSLLPWWEMTCAAFAIRADVARHCHYYLGLKPALFPDPTHRVDIDTEEDFRLAQLLYRNRACLR